MTALADHPSGITSSPPRRRRRGPAGLRSRWAAIGAAVAVSLGAGGLGLAGASTGVESSFVSVTPARVLDTRAGLGLDGPLASPTPRVLQVTGSIDRPNGSAAVVVPEGASAVVLNVTVVGPSADGFVSVRPDGTPGAPETSNLNFAAGDIIPNAVTVALPSSGAIELTYDAFGGVGPTTDALVDVTGFYVAASGGGGAPGPEGPAGEQGPKGDTGAQGASGIDPAPGKFTQTQIIEGGILECGSVIEEGRTCEDPTLNGLPLAWATQQTTLPFVCERGTGGIPIWVRESDPTATPTYSWNVEDSTWEIVEDDSFIDGLSCHFPF